MIYYVGGVMCQKVMEDSNSKSTSYIDDLAGTAINVTSFPFSLPPFIISISLGHTNRIKKETCELRMILKKPSSEGIVAGPYQAHFNKNNILSRINVTVPVVTIEKEGEHFIHVEIKKKTKWIEVAKFPFIVNVVVAEEKEGVERP